MTDTPECATCVTVGRRGYCAPGRCYCGHESCHAFASWYELPALPTASTDQPKTTPNPSSWSDRDEATWIDKL